MSINEAINIQTTSINAIAPTTGSLSIGDSQTTGILNLGTNSGRTGGINIGSTTGTGTINIQTASALFDYGNPAISIGTTTSAKTIRIGSSISPVRISLGDFNVNTSLSDNTVFMNTIATTSRNIDFGNDQVTGKLNLGCGLYPNARSGNINIATSVGSTCAINILNGGGATTGGSVNIANGASQTTAVNIASGTGTGTVTIGGASNTTNLNSGTVNVNGILTMGTGDNITLQPTAGYVAPSAGQLGSSISSTGTTITLSGITLLKSVVLTSGVWILYGNCRYTTPGAFAGLGIGVSTTLIDYDSASAAIGINGMVLQVTRIVSSTTGQTYNLLANTQLNGGVTNVGLFAYRIA